MVENPRIKKFNVQKIVEWPIGQNLPVVLPDGVVPVRLIENLEQLRSLAQEDRAILLLRPEKKWKEKDWLEISQRLHGRQTYFEFPGRKIEENQFTAPEILRLINVLNDLPYPIRLRCYPGLETLDERIAPELELEPKVQIVQEINPAKITPDVSVIIPFYNSAHSIGATLQSLAAAQGSGIPTEVILVDDGSTDSSSQIAIEFLANAKLPFKLLHQARSQIRVAGDNLYRAGIARNSGVRFANSEWLLFLDSDILLPPDFLTVLARELDSADVFQAQRFQIKSDLKSAPKNYSDIAFPDATFLKEPEHWNAVHTASDWMDIPHFWKYVCTYCLALRRKDLIAAGKFNRTFTTYGFEDVDLGYRLAKMGKRFRLLPSKVYHIEPPVRRSEYSQASPPRQQLLRRTADIFFRQHLDPEIFRAIGPLIDGTS